MADWQIERLERAHVRDTFSCGKPPLDEFIRRLVSQYEKRNLGRTYVAVRPGEDVLILETMYFADEIRTPSEELDSLPQDVSFAGRELEVAKKLVESLSVQWSPEDYHNTYRARVEELIERKREGHAVGGGHGGDSSHP